MLLLAQDSTAGMLICSQNLKADNPENLMMMAAPTPSLQDCYK
jgi:hypothetical protein